MYLYIYGSFNNAVSSFNSIVLNVWLTVNKLLEKMKKELYIQGSVHHEIYANNCPTRCSYVWFIYIFNVTGWERVPIQSRS